MSFRYHAATLAAVLFALAAGVALGAGVLDRGNDDEAQESTSAEALSSLRSFEVAYAEETSQPLVKGTLRRTDVTIFELPGVSRTLVNAVTESIGAADGRVVSTVALTEKLLDSSNRTFADGVAEQATEGVSGVRNSQGSYGRVGAALTRAFFADERASLDDDAQAIASAFTEGGLLSVRGEPTQAGTVAIFLTGSDLPTGGQSEIVAELAVALDAAKIPVVVAGPSTQSLDDGLISSLAESDAATVISTSDVMDSAAGRSLLPLIVAQEVGGESGAYGTSRASDGAFPQP